MTPADHADTSPGEGTGRPSPGAKGHELTVVIAQRAWWTDHVAELREALLDAASLPVTPPPRSPASRNGISDRATALAADFIATALGFLFQLGREPHLRLTLTVEEAAELLGISRALAYDVVHRGEIPHMKIGRRILVPRAVLDRMLQGDVESTSPSADESPPHSGRGNE